MAELERKIWYKSSPIIVGILAIVYGAYTSLSILLAKNCGNPSEACVILPGIPAWIVSLLGGIGIYGSTKTITVVKKEEL